MNFRSAFHRMADAFNPPSREQVEQAYLNKSVSMADLERRQREIQHGKFREI